MRNFLIPILTILAFLLAGCGSGGDSPQAAIPETPVTEPPVVQPPVAQKPSLAFGVIPGAGGRNSVTALKGATPGTQRASSATSLFDVGDVKTTTTYLFMLRNTGSIPISNIHLVTDNPSIEVSPAAIQILSPDGTGGLSPIIQVTVLHGSGAGHFGYAPQLAAGALAFHITATGMSTGGTVLADANISGTVRLAAAQVEIADELMDYNGRPAGIANLQIYGHADLPFAAGRLDALSIGLSGSSSLTALPTATKDITIRNIGNQTLEVTVYGWSQETPAGILKSTRTVLAGQTCTFPQEVFFSQDNQYRVYGTSVEIWSHGAVFDERILSVPGDLLRVGFQTQFFVSQNG